LATTNAHKVREIAGMFAATGDAIEVMSAAELGTPPKVDETSDSFSGNAVLKALGFAAWIRGLAGASPDDFCVADDSGICIDALEGAPGVRSARFAGEDATDDANNAAMVGALRGLGLDRSAAHYACVLAVARVDGAPLVLASPRAAERRSHRELDGALLFEGRCEGEVRVARRGQGGFGYDPHFWIDGGARTFADLSDEEKSHRSHRGEALRAMMARWPEFGG
jgi:XTP/dITP diphosphohydrolase